MSDKERPGSSPETQVGTKAQYRAGPARSALTFAAPVEGEPRRPYAVFVAHGMGQQIPFQTLDAVAEGLRLADGRRRQRQKQPPAKTAPVVRAVTFGDERLQRVELTLATDDGEREVHVYEAYWAPFTEGQVTLRDVMNFLLIAGGHGIRNGTKPFERWVFGAVHRFSAPIRTVIFLLVALAVVGALVAMNATIVLVGAARSMLKDPPHWLGPGLFSDLSTTLNVWLIVVVAFSASLLAAKVLRANRQARLYTGALSALLFVGTLFVTIASGVAMPLIFMLHTHSGAVATEYWAVLGGAQAVGRFNRLVDWLVVLGLLGTALVVLVRFIVKLLVAWGRELGSAEDRGGKAFSSLVVWLFQVFVVGVVIEVVLFFLASRAVDPGHYTASTLLRGAAWPLLLAVSALVRHVFVQYVGDVAAYVQPHTLDRFYNLRQRIKESVRKNARAIYAARERGGHFVYESVAIVGHSLGSVIVYDTLNRLLSDDELATGGIPAAEVLHVKERTRVLVTFGSPLDKIAFVFGLQGHETSEAREALAATVQPMIREDVFRTFPWINIFSRWDLISGRLDFFDPPDGSIENAVENFVDPDASTLVVAHTEYWGNTLLFEKLFQTLSTSDRRLTGAA